MMGEKPNGHSLAGKKNEENGNFFQIENSENISKREQIQQIDAIAQDPAVGPETFAHLDTNKILRKCDLRLVPMLTLLVSIALRGG